MTSMTPSDSTRNLSESFPSTVYLCVAVLGILFLRGLLYTRSLRHFPTIGGPSFPILSYIGVYNYYYRNKATLQKGHDQYKGRAFKIALLDQWIVVITGKQLIEELSKMPEDRASFAYGVTEMTGMMHAFGEDVWRPPYHVDIMRAVLTRHIAPLFGEIYNEVETAFQELIPTHKGDWVPIHAMGVMRQIVARVSGRVFIGLPTCHDPKYLDMAMNMAKDFGTVRKYLPILPATLKPLFTRYVSSIDYRAAQARRVLGPMIAERMQKLKDYGKAEYPDKPDDMLMWITEEAFQRGQGLDLVIRTFLFAVFASIHTSSNMFTHALYYVAADLEIAAVLREEAEQTIRSHGWTKAAMAQMRKADSLFRECTRHHGIHTSSLNRKAMEPIVFSDGTYIPKGTVMIAPTIQTHHDEALYDNAWVFNPWRFESLRDEDELGLKHHFSTTSPEYIAFGHGKHACPGRFFAANELKAMMAYLVLNYDVAFAQEGVRPTDSFGIMAISPDPTAEVLFRKRQTT